MFVTALAFTLIYYFSKKILCHTGIFFYSIRQNASHMVFICFEYYYYIALYCN